MKISIVTITFNNYEELIETLKSVETQSHIEQVVVNGGKCERTRKFLESRPDIISVSESDKGISDAFNKGFKLSSGEAIIYLNSGDRLRDPEYLNKCRVALADPQVGFCYSSIMFEDEYAGNIVIQPEGLGLGRGMPYPHQSMLVRRTVFEKIGLFNLDYKNAMCFDFACRLQMNQIKGAMIDSIAISQDGLGVSAKQEAATIRESKSILEKYNLIDSKVRLDLCNRWLRYFLRKLLVEMHLRKLLVIAKKIRRSQKSDLVI